MPSKYPVLKPQVVIAVLQKFGFSFVSQKGSHAKYSDGTHVIIIPMHDEVARLVTTQSNRNFYHSYL